MRPSRRTTKSLGAVADFLNSDLDQEFRSQEISGISSASSRVEQGDLFVALPGAHSHGATFIDAAISRGAAAILTDDAGVTILGKKKFPLILIQEPRTILGPLTSWFYSNPSHSLPIFGITGTNGKTTTSYLLRQIWSYAGRSTGLIGTIGIAVGDDELPTRHTTPEADQLQSLFALMKERNLFAATMEVSSHALVQHRVTGIHFQACAFTNLTQDHLDFHGTMENYYQAKRSLFTDRFTEKALISIDSEYGRRLHDEIDIPKAALSRRDDAATWFMESEKRSDGGWNIAIRSHDAGDIRGHFALLGEHNLENLLAAVALAFESGIDADVISQALPTLRGAPGRLERIENKREVEIFVDFAHTTEAVERTLATVKAATRGRVIALLGCGGDRDRTKRPLMGAALNNGADIPIFTSDNPRSEDAEAILNEMTTGIAIKAGGQVIADRKAAIHHALSIAQPGDTVIVLGKGHETGQEIDGVIYPFSDSEILREAVAQ